MRSKIKLIIVVLIIIAILISCSGISYSPDEIKNKLLYKLGEVENVVCWQLTYFNIKNDNLYSLYILLENKTTIHIDKQSIMDIYFGIDLVINELNGKDED